jgi:serine protease Do
LIPGIVAAVVLAGCGGTPTPPPTGGDSAPGFKSEADLVARIQQSAVKITVTVGKDTQWGSGVIIDAAKGFVLTNAHVVEGASSLKIRLNDGSEVPGRLVASAPCDDLAVLAFAHNPAKLIDLKIGDSNALRAGDQVTGVGYPASFQNSSKEKPSATQGIVSAVDVSAEGDPSLPTYPSVIEHQATINPGNSGGPLVNSRGELVGINTLTAATDANNNPIQGQYYSIASNHIKGLLPDLRAGKSSVDIGWSIVPNSAAVAAAVKSAANVDLPSTDGLFVQGVTTGSPADEQHLETADIILDINGTPVKTFQQVCDIVASHGPGQVLRVHGLSTLGQPPEFHNDVKLR